MKITTKVRFVTILLLLWSVGHLLLLGIYHTEGKGAPDVVKKITRFYIFPLFIQNFKVFAPEPPLRDSRLFIRTYSDKRKWTKWSDPGLKQLIKHKSNRLWNYEKQFLIYRRWALALIHHHKSTFSQSSNQRWNVVLLEDSALMDVTQTFILQNWGNDSAYNIDSISLCGVEVLTPSYNKFLEGKSECNLNFYPYKSFVISD